MSASTTDATTDEVIELSEFSREWEDWHRAHEQRRADPHGFLAVAGLYWLSADPTVVPGTPGIWRTGDDGPVVELSEGESLTLDGVELTGHHDFGEIAERGGITVGFSDGVIEIARRGGRDVLRPRRPDFPFLASYAGTPTYSPDPQWRVPATFVAYDELRPYEVGSAVDGLSHVYESPGYLEFALRGETVQLVAFPGHVPGTLDVLFTDATSGVTTYAANRTLTVQLTAQNPDAVGHTVIDFNRAVNLPCAYTDFATCPLPPAENRLAVGIEAGEKTPFARAHGVVTESSIRPVESAG